MTNDQNGEASADISSCHAEGELTGSNTPLFAVNLVDDFGAHNFIARFSDCLDEIKVYAVGQTVAESGSVEGRRIEIDSGVKVMVDQHVEPGVVGDDGRRRRRDGERNIRQQRRESPHRSAAGIGRILRTLERELLI